MEATIMNSQITQPFDIRPGGYYSNGSYGRAWGVRQVIQMAHPAEAGSATLLFKGIAGTCRRKTGECSLEEFRKWARYEVALNENSWQRIGYMEEVFPDEQPVGF